MDAMSDAIDGADVMLYGVSLRYKESANVRIAHTRTHQQPLDCTACSAGQALRLTVPVSYPLVTSVPIGSQLCPSARAGHVTSDGAEGI
jgi:hypothetical protein